MTTASAFRDASGHPVAVHPPPRKLGAGSVGEARRGLLAGHVRGHLIELTDRIVLTLPEGDADLLAHRDWIAREVLADEIDLRETSRSRRSSRPSRRIRHRRA
jgi:hypothetical protein